MASQENLSTDRCKSLSGDEQPWPGGGYQPIFSSEAILVVSGLGDVFTTGRELGEADS